LDRLFLAAVLVALAGYGLVISCRRLRAILARKSFLHDFAERFSRYLQSHGQDDTLYVELTQRVGRMQMELGPHGIMAMYRPPFANYAYTNFQVLINLLPEFRQAAASWGLENQARQHADTIRDVLLRYSGDLDTIEQSARSDLRNPVVWFREGVGGVLSIPFRLLGSLGILTPSIESAITGSVLLRLASGVVALITLLAAIVQILTGWEASIAFLRKLFQR
jgi:hypothetical protein